MRHRRLRRKLGVRTHHRRALLRNLVRSLVIFKSIRTTYAKAKEASSFADRMITIAKRGDLNARRLLIQRLGNPEVAHTLVTQIAPHFKDKNGGYTRVLRLGFRHGDNAQVALLEFSTLIEQPKKLKKPKKEKKPQDLKTKEKVDSEKVKKEKVHEKEFDEAPKVKKAPSKEEKSEKDAVKEKKESEKKGGFLSALRKFLKGDEPK